MKMVENGVDFARELCVLVDKVCVLIDKSGLVGGEVSNGVFEPVCGGFSGGVVCHGRDDGGRSNQC